MFWKGGSADVFQGGPASGRGSSSRIRKIKAFVCIVFIWVVLCLPGREPLKLIFRYACFSDYWYSLGKAFPLRFQFYGQQPGRDDSVSGAIKVSVFIRVVNRRKLQVAHFGKIGLKLTLRKGDPAFTGSLQRL